MSCGCILTIMSTYLQIKNAYPDPPYFFRFSIPILASGPFFSEGVWSGLTELKERSTQPVGASTDDPRDHVDLTGSFLKDPPHFGHWVAIGRTHLPHRYSQLRGTAYQLSGPIKWHYGWKGLWKTSSSFNFQLLHRNWKWYFERCWC